MLSEFHSTLGEMKKDKPLVVLVDGVDLVQDDKGQFSSDWIPQLLPQVGNKKIKKKDFVKLYILILLFLIRVSV